MRNVRRTAVGIGAIVAGVGIMASLSWACTPQAMLSAIQPETGSPGSMVAVRGNHFDTAQVEIRWNTEDGRLLALASGPDVNTTVRIPDVAPGTYYVVALGRSAADPSQIAGKAVQPFTVTASTSSTAPPAGGGGTTPTGQATTAPGAAPAPTSSPAGTAPAAGSTAPSAAADPQPSQTPGNVDAPGTAPATATAPAATGSLPAAASAQAEGAATRPASASKGTVATPGRPALTSPVQGSAVGAAVSEAIADADNRPSGRTATGEAWSGFATASPGPGLSGGSTPAPASSGAGPILFFGGLLALFAAATVALVHQRRLQKA